VSLDFGFILKILQVGFSGFVFLMALFSYRLIRNEQDREDEPREEILNQLSSFRLWAFLVALLVLLSPILESFVNTKLSEKSIPEVSWSYTIPDSQNTNFFQCTADGANIGTPIDCKSYKSCDIRSLNLNVCRGLFYKGAIENHPG